MPHPLNADVAAARRIERLAEARIEHVASQVKGRRQRRPTIPIVDIRPLSKQSERFGRMPWWVPAGIATLILFYAFLGA